MVGIIVVSHGNMAAGMLEATRMIVGEMEGIVAVGLQEADAVENLMERITDAISSVDTGDGVLILVDVFGASPFNASARLAMVRDKIEVISGMNLPMLLEIAIQQSEGDLDALVHTALDVGSSSIRTLSQTLKKD